MTSDIIQYASIAGELAKNLWGRTDFQKYDFAWAKAQNWIVDYHGGLYSRAGFEFADVIEWNEGENVRFVPFQYSPDIENTYMVIFTDDKIRFAQDNAYVLEAAKTVTSLANDVGDRVQFTSNSHGFENGDWIKLSGFTTNSSFNNRTFEVANKTANTFTLVDVITNSALEVASVTTEAGEASRIYTLASPYGEEYLPTLIIRQIRDELRITHPDFPPKTMVRASATSWTIANTDFSISITYPTNLAYTASATVNYRGFVYQITAINVDGEESIPASYVMGDVGDIDAHGQRYISLTWTAVTGAVSYNVYRSAGVHFNASAGDISSDAQVGFIGNTAGLKFSDPGITPDFSRKPPIDYNPFASAAIRYVTVSAVGSGAKWNSAITWPGGGTGAAGYIVTVGSFSAHATTSPVHGIRVLSGGSGYTDTSVSVAAAAGETLTAVLSPSTGNNPACLTLFQQRLVYGATDNYPLRVFGSRIGFLDNFGFSDVGADDESYEFDIDSVAVSPLRHLIPVRGGLLIFNQIGVWLLFGGNEELVSGNNARADLQNSVGASIVEPVYVDSFVIYVSHDGQELRLLAYDDYSKLYGGKNVSLLSNHLFTPTNAITSLTFAPIPTKTLFCTQTGGELIAASIDIENNVYAMTPQRTKGYFRYVSALSEDNESRLYAAVEREIGGRKLLFLERMERRKTFTHLEASFCLDAALKYTQPKPVARLTPSTFTGTVTFTASASVFSAADEDKILRCGCGAKAVITNYVSGTEIKGTWLVDLDEHYPEDENRPAEFASGQWTLTEPVTTVTGLWHLEGEEVVILADGAVVTGKTVTNGSITLDTAASAIVIGFSYKCKAQSLPLAVTDLPIEGRRKNIKGVALRMHETIGLKIGSREDEVYEIANRAQRLFATAAALRDEVAVEFIRGDWSADNQVWFIQDTPRPAAILNFIRDTELGDDKD